MGGSEEGTTRQNWRAVSAHLNFKESAPHLRQETSGRDLVNAVHNELLAAIKATSGTSLSKTMVYISDFDAISDGFYSTTR